MGMLSTSNLIGAAAACAAVFAVRSAESMAGIKGPTIGGKNGDTKLLPEGSPNNGVPASLWYVPLGIAFLVDKYI